MRYQAILNIYENIGVINGEGENEKVFDKDGNRVVIDEDLVSAEIYRLKDEYKSLEYKRNRKKEFDLQYPIAEQLDYIFHHGLAKWKTDIVQPIKDKYPKPSK